jgi:hypothetical protein
MTVSNSVARAALATVLALAVLAIDSPALAYSWKECLGRKIKWDTNTPTIRASTTSFPAGGWRDAMNEAVAAFNRNPSRLNWRIRSDSGGVGRGNGQNEVWGSTDSGLLNGAPARAFTRWKCFWFFGKHVKLTELDIAFDYRSPWQWTFSKNKNNLLRYGGSLRPIQTTALHELGHGGILNHVNSEYNVMGIDFEHIHVNGNTARAYLGEDTGDGLAFLYGLASPRKQDLGVVHWRYDSASGEYSNHRKTRLFDSGGSPLSAFNDGGEARFRVSRGQLVATEFTYENNGASTHSGIRVGYYISTNSTISTLDRRIGGASLTLARDNVFTWQRNVRIPRDLVRGRDYWLGVIIDERNEIDEVAEWNNATYLPIRVN